MTKNLAKYRLRVYGKIDDLPPVVEEFFANELAEFHRLEPDEWGFSIICAMDEQEQVIGGAYFEYGPRKNLDSEDNPLGEENIAILEQILVLPEYRRRGLATKILTEALDIARGMGCQHMRCNTRWDDPAEIGLYKNCGFALTDIDAGQFFTVKPLCV